MKLALPASLIFLPEQEPRRDDSDEALPPQHVRGVLFYQIIHITERNPQASIAQGDKIHDQVGMLLGQPGLGRPCRIDKTRELVISDTPFIVVYRHKPHLKRIDVIRLLHGSQQWRPDCPARHFAGALLCIGWYVAAD